jgi:hypothetical protein
MRSSTSITSLVQQLGQHDVAVEQARPVLVGDAQRVAEAARDGQHGRFALALQQRVGGDRGAHLDRFDQACGNGLARRQAQQVADAGDGGVAVLLRVLGQQLVGHEAPSGRRATMSVKVPPRSIQNCQSMCIPLVNEGLL